MSKSTTQHITAFGFHDRLSFARAGEVGIGTPFRTDTGRKSAIEMSKCRAGWLRDELGSFHSDVRIEVSQSFLRLESKSLGVSAGHLFRLDVITDITGLGNTRSWYDRSFHASISTRST